MDVNVTNVVIDAPEALKIAGATPSLQASAKTVRWRCPGWDTRAWNLGHYRALIIRTGKPKAPPPQLPV